MDLFVLLVLNKFKSISFLSSQIRETRVGRTIKSRLSIPSTKEFNFGFYKCSASNVVGLDEASLQLSGLPGPVTITSGLI